MFATALRPVGTTSLLQPVISDSTGPSNRPVRGSVMSNTGNGFTAVFDIDGKQFVFVANVGDAYGPPFYSFTTLTLTYEYIGDLSGKYSFEGTVDRNINIRSSQGGRAWRLYGAVEPAVSPPAHVENASGTWFSA